MKKVRTKVKMLAVTAAVTAMAAAGNAYIPRAGEQINDEISSIQLNVEKEDRDTIKIYLSNFTELTKSMQLSLKIDGNNVKFNDENIEWLVDKKSDDNTEENADDSDETSDNVVVDYKINNDKNAIDFFMVSDKPLNSDGGIIEICKIDVSENKSLADKLLRAKDTNFRVVPNTENGDAYSYVTYATNKNISGDDIENADDTVMNLNSKPVIKFKDVPSVLGDKIVILKGNVFRISDYVEAEDADGNAIEDIKYTGKVDSKKVGTYNITCKVTDSNNETTELKTTVVVEETVGNFGAPTIHVPDEDLKTTVGKKIDVLEGVTATDYQGRELEVKADDNYDLSIPNVYTVTYSATDARNVTVTNTRRLIVADEDSSDNDTEVTPGEIPPEIKDIMDEVKDIEHVSGNGTSSTPLLVDATNLSGDDFRSFLANIMNKFEVSKTGYDKEDEYKTVHIKLKKKTSMFSLASLFRNSERIHMSIRVGQSRNDLLVVMDQFADQIKEEDTNKPNKPQDTNKPGDSNGSGGSDNSGTGSGGSNNSGGSSNSGSSSSSGSSGSSSNSGNSSNLGSSTASDSDRNSDDSLEVVAEMADNSGNPVDEAEELEIELEDTQDDAENMSDDKDSDDMTDEKDNSVNAKNSRSKSTEETKSSGKMAVFAGVFAVAAAGAIGSVLHFKKKGKK